MGYLVLSRRKGERVFIGEAELIVRSIEGSFVKLAISAPKEVPILRADAKKRVAPAATGED